MEEVLLVLDVLELLSSIDQGTMVSVPTASIWMVMSAAVKFVNLY